MTDLAIIAGSSFEQLPELKLERELRPPTPWGEPASSLQFGGLDGSPVWFLSRHGHDHGLAPHAVNYRANLQALADQGVRRILALYTVGAIPEAMKPGSLVVPHDLVDYTWGREHSFSTPGNVLHVEMSEPFSDPLRLALLQGAHTVCAGATDPAVFDAGVYACTQGPRLETAAEIDRLERDGCDIVGMTAMPEVGLARELDIEIAGIGLVVNPAAGRGDISMDEIQAVAAAGRARLLKVLAETLRLL